MTTAGTSRGPDRPRRILVTGGAGFIGSHLCERLLERGDRVVSLDNYFTGARDNVAHLLAEPRFEARDHDVTRPIPSELGEDVDEIYNLACPASPVHYRSDPVETIRTNVLGAIHVLDVAQRCGAKVLQASTSEVYGDPEIHPQPESYWGRVNPIGTRACYDEGKRCAETLFFDYHRQHGVAIKVARIFNTYGPRMRPDDGRVVSTFIGQALDDLPITIFGDGRQTRSFCHVDDLVEGLIRLMATGEDVTGPVNLGRPQEFTMLELALRVIDETGSRSRIEFRPLPEDDPVMRRPDIELARSLLGWEPKIDLDRGLQETIAYFRRLRGQASRP